MGHVSVVVSVIATEKKMLRCLIQVLLNIILPDWEPRNHEDAHDFLVTVNVQYEV